MATRDAVLSAVNITELRYLRKAIRWRLHTGRANQPEWPGFRTTPPSSDDARNIRPERRDELDAIANWILQSAC